MRPFALAFPRERVKVLALGAHSDDIEIGAGGAILDLIANGAALDITWCVASANGARGLEAAGAAEAFLAGAASVRLDLASFPDSRFPEAMGDIKTWIEAIRAKADPDIIFTHRRDDAHQDHRTMAQLTSNAFRNHLVFEYEIPKWDGDLGQPNFYIPLNAGTIERKTALLDRHFGSQRGKDWFDADTFRGLARLRGMECRAPHRFAEGFCLRKAVGGLFSTHTAKPPSHLDEQNRGSQ